MVRPRTNPNSVVRDPAFASRLLKACEGHPEIPSFGQGQQSWIKDRLGVSSEGVRKWFAGEAKPRPGKLKQIASLLEVDEAWLSLGIVPEAGPKEKKVRNAMADGSVNVVAGLIQMNGGYPAFPVDGDLRSEFIDIYTIIKGKQYSIHVTRGENISENHFRFRIPNEYKECTIIGVIQQTPVRLILLNIPTSAIDNNRTRKGGYLEVLLRKVAQYDFRLGEEKCPRIMSFSDQI